MILPFYKYTDKTGLMLNYYLSLIQIERNLKESGNYFQIVADTKKEVKIELLILEVEHAFKRKKSSDNG